jgi:hypothetical protein
MARRKWNLGIGPRDSRDGTNHDSETGTASAAFAGARGQASAGSEAIMKGRREPLLGWRIWRLRRGSLDSWGVDYSWQEGENRACCLALEWRRCQASPGRDCQCGFWGLFRPLELIQRARHDHRDRTSVVGLIRAWGEIAIHGSEGFRAEKAAVVCLFTDGVRDKPLLPESRWLPSWPRLQRDFTELFGSEVDPSRRNQLETAGLRYGVPLLSLRDALQCGLLDELGIEAVARKEVERWIRAPAA